MDGPEKAGLPGFGSGGRSTFIALFVKAKALCADEKLSY
jgi:hypothetical protein